MMCSIKNCRNPFHLGSFCLWSSIVLSSIGEQNINGINSICCCGMHKGLLQRTGLGCVSKDLLDLRMSQCVFLFAFISLGILIECVFFHNTISSFCITMFHIIRFIIFCFFGNSSYSVIKSSFLLVIHSIDDVFNGLFAICIRMLKFNIFGNDLISNTSNNFLGNYFFGSV